MSDQALRSQIIRLASSLPKGDPTRRKLLAAANKSASMFEHYVPPPTLNWDTIGRQFQAAHHKWWEGLKEYKAVMELIEQGAKRAGPEYREVATLAKRGVNTARQLMDQQNAIQDDLYSMQRAMPETVDED